MRASTIKKWALIIGILIVLTSFLFVGVNTFYKGPEWDDYRPADCPEGEFDRPTPIEVEGSEEYDPECYEYSNTAFEEVEDSHGRVEFVILMILGVLVLIAGALIKHEAIGYGFMFSGVLTLFINIMGHWELLNDYLRFIILGVALAILLYLGYKKLKD